MSSTASSSNVVYSPVTDISFNDLKPALSEKKDSVLFWGENPNVILQHPTELFPTQSMSNHQSLNAITRLVVLFTLIGFFMTGSLRLLFILAITLGAIYFWWFFQLEKKKKTVRFAEDEGFANPTTTLFKLNGDTVPGPETFLAPSSTNPFGNTLMTDYDYNPNKKPAPPAFNANTNEDILNKSKQMVIEANPGQPDIADKLFHDLGEQLVFEQSMRPFYSNPATTIPNDQTSFAEFCYGSMISCKEGNKFACARNLARYTNV
jgi:hypothetical protein